MIRLNSGFADCEELKSLFLNRLLPLYSQWMENSFAEYEVLLKGVQASAQHLKTMNGAVNNEIPGSDNYTSPETILHPDNTNTAIETAYKKPGGSASTALVDRQREYNSALLDLLSTMHQRNQYNELKDFQQLYREQVDKLLEDLDSSTLIYDTFPHYSIAKRENPLVSLHKQLANSKHMLAKRFLPVEKLLPSERLKTNYRKGLSRKRTIPVKNIAAYFLFLRFAELNHPNTATIMTTIHKGIWAMWKQDEALDELPELCAKELQELNRVKELLNLNNLQLVDQLFDEMKTALEKADTFEFPNRKVTAAKIRKQTEKAEAGLLNHLESWQNTGRALVDDWAVDVEMVLLHFSVFHQFQHLLGKMSKFNQQELQGTFSSIRQLLETARERLEKQKTANHNSVQTSTPPQSAEQHTAIADSDATTRQPSAQTISGLIDLINEERKRSSSVLIDQLLAKATEELTSCFGADFEQMRQESGRLVAQVSSNRAFLSRHSYLVPAKKKELKYISPHELLRFAAWPQLMEKISAVEQHTETHLEKVRVNLLAIGSVFDFALESALIILNNQTENAEKALHEATDGLDRALNHLDKAIKILIDIQVAVDIDLRQAIKRFNQNIQQLKNTENLLELHLRITRIKTLNRIKNLRQQAIRYFREYGPKARYILLDYYGRVNAVVNDLKVRIGITVEKKYLSFELSEFVEQTRESLQRLPFVYQRLYQLNPTDEERFFVNRTAELNQLSGAYENWKKDRYVTVALIGDKGSGITSLINYFIRANNITLPVIRHTFSHKTFRTEDYFASISEIFETDLPADNQQLIQLLNNTESTRIVILENLQHLFLKQVNGFECMNLFFELMAHTMKKIMWIGAYTSHSWNYLDKTIHISNYFTDEILLHPLSRQVLEEIIYKRNRLSGYHITYQPPVEITKQRKFQQMNQQAQQDHLRKYFFLVLRQLSAGNISLAQMYWLRATKLTGEDQITAAPIGEFDFQFLKNLAANELFALQTLIIHDGLSLEDFSSVMNMPINAARNLLLPMYEKGMLIRPKQKYNINPIIFKPVADYLASRNFVN